MKDAVSACRSVLSSESASSAPLPVAKAESRLSMEEQESFRQLPQLLAKGARRLQKESQQVFAQ